MKYEGIEDRKLAALVEAVRPWSRELDQRPDAESTRQAYAAISTLHPRSSGNGETEFYMNSALLLQSAVPVSDDSYNPVLHEHLARLCLRVSGYSPLEQEAVVDLIKDARDRASQEQPERGNDQQLEGQISGSAA